MDRADDIWPRNGSQQLPVLSSHIASPPSHVETLEALPSPRWLVHLNAVLVVAAGALAFADFDCVFDGRL